jgi:hypothetical protein
LRIITAAKWYCSSTDRRLLMIALRRTLAAALLLGTGTVGACVYDPYTGAYLPCCAYYGYPYYRYPPPYYYGPQPAPYYAPPPNQPSAYPTAPQIEPPPPPQPGATSYPHAGLGGVTQNVAAANVAQ